MAGRPEAQMLTPQWKEEGSRCPPRAADPHSGSGWAQELMNEEPPGPCELSPCLHQGAAGWSSPPQRQKGSVKPRSLIWEWPQAAA